MGIHRWVSARRCAVLIGLIFSAVPGRALAAPIQDFEAAQQSAVTGQEFESKDSGLEQVRGMTISCQTWGWEWGSDGFEAELDRLAALGVNWIAIHPYARIQADGRVTWRPIEVDDPPAYLARPIRATRERGMALFVKPHLAYWGGPFSWRGEIDFPDPVQRARFFRDYSNWILELARATRGAAAFAVGTELDQLARPQDEAEWRDLVRAVRAETDSHLTFASNWTDYQKLPFWDALDCIGVQGYFPLSLENNPQAADLEAGWQKILGDLSALHMQTGKPVILTELGYNNSLQAAAKPWDYRSSSDPAALALQSRCLQVGLETLDRESSWLRGAFLWKWFVGAAPGENFILDQPHMRAVMSSTWSK